jgi:outer membrane protein
MIYSCLFSILFVLMVSVPFAASGAEWTLGQTIETALQVSGAGKIEKLDADEAVLETADVRSKRYPQLSLAADAKVVSDVMEIEMPLNTIRFGDYDSYNLSVAVTQMLYDGGRLRSLEKAGQARVRMNESEALAANLESEFRAKTAFFGILLARRQLDAAVQNREEAANHLKDIQALRGQGMALENDVIRSKLRVSTADLALHERESAFSRSVAAFRRVVDIPPDESVDIVWEGAYEPAFDGIHPGDIEKSRPEFRAFDAATEAAGYVADAARAGRRPKIGLGAGMNYGRPGLDMPANEWMHYASGGVSLDWDLWNWGETGRAIAKADITARKVTENRREFAREMEWRLVDAQTAFDESRNRRILAGEALIFAESNLSVVSAAARAGTVTETEYDNAHAAFSQAQMDAAAADVAVWLSTAQVEYVLGIRYKGGVHE